MQEPIPREINRTELYRMVWSETMARVAQEFGLSGPQMGQVCRKHNIPCPAVGHWSRLDAGNASPMAALPNPTNDYTIQIRPKSPRRVRHFGEHVIAAIRPELPIKVPRTLHNCHKLVSLAREQLEAVGPRSTGLIVVPDHVSLALKIQTSTACLQRALCVMDALLKAFEQRSFEVEPGPTAVVFGCPVRFMLSEQLKSGKQERTRQGHSALRMPSGRLELRIDSVLENVRQQWSETQSRSIEDLLPEFLAEIVKIAALRQEREQDRNRAEQQRRAEEKAHEEMARLRAQERARVESERARERDRIHGLMQEVENWKQSQNLRQYIQARRERHLAKFGAVEPGSGFAQWLDWASQQADRLDPLTTSPPSILDEVVEPGGE